MFSKERPVLNKLGFIILNLTAIVIFATTLNCSQSGTQLSASPDAAMSSAGLFEALSSGASSAETAGVIEAVKSWTIPQAVDLLRAFTGVSTVAIDGYAIAERPFGLSANQLAAAAAKYPTLGSLWQTKTPSATTLTAETFSRSLDALLERSVQTNLVTTADDYALQANLFAGAIIALTQQSASADRLALVGSGMTNPTPVTPMQVGAQRANLALQNAQQRLQSGSRCEPRSDLLQANAHPLAGYQNWTPPSAVFSRQRPALPGSDGKAVAVGARSVSKDASDDELMGRDVAIYADGAVYDAAVGAEGSTLFYCAIPLDSSDNQNQALGVELYLGQRVMQGDL